VTVNPIHKKKDKLSCDNYKGVSLLSQLFTLRRLAETYIEFSKYLYVCYVDFKKAFDSVWRSGLWKAMRFLSYEDKIVRLLEALYKDTMSAVRVDGDLSEWFITISGVMQGCLRHLSLIGSCYCT